MKGEIMPTVNEQVAETQRLGRFLIELADAIVSGRVYRVEVRFDPAADWAEQKAHQAYLLDAYYRIVYELETVYVNEYPGTRYAHSALENAEESRGERCIRTRKFVEAETVWEAGQTDEGEQ